MQTPGPSLKTREASSYLLQRGVAASTSFLQKVRIRGPEDERDPGPDFERDEAGICWYPVEALDRYAALRLAARKFRGPAPQPRNFLKQSTSAN